MSSFTSNFNASSSSSTTTNNRAVRLARNVAEKQRRDKLNSYINELANTVPLVANASKRLDKTSVLRLSAAYLRLHSGKYSTYACMLVIRSQQTMPGRRV